MENKTAEEKYPDSMAEYMARTDPENLADEIDELKKLVLKLTERVEELENPDEPVHPSALCMETQCRNCGLCEDYRRNGGRI